MFAIVCVYVSGCDCVSDSLFAIVCVCLFVLACPCVSVVACMCMCP